MSHVQELRAVVNAARAGDPVLARMHLQRAASEQPDHPAVWLWMGWLADSPLVMARCLEMVLESAATEYHEVAEKGLDFARALTDFQVPSRIPELVDPAGHRSASLPDQERQTFRNVDAAEEPDPRFEPLADEVSVADESDDPRDFTTPGGAVESCDHEVSDTQSDRDRRFAGEDDFSNDDDGLPESFHRALAVTRSEFEEEPGCECGWEAIAAHPEAPVLTSDTRLDHDDSTELDPALDDTVIEPQSSLDSLDDPHAELPEMDHWPESPRAAGWPSAPAIPASSAWSAETASSDWPDTSVPPPLPPEATAQEATEWNRETPVEAQPQSQDQAEKPARWTAPEPSPNTALWRAAQSNWFESGHSAAQPGVTGSQVFLRGGTRPVEAGPDSAAAWTSNIAPEPPEPEERAGRRLWESAVAEAPGATPSKPVPPAVTHEPQASDILPLNGRQPPGPDESGSHGFAASPVRDHGAVTVSSDAGLTDAATPVSPIGVHTVLVVDDSPTVRKLVTMTLEKHGYQVVSAFDGVAAIKEIAAHNPSLILMDVNMPRLDGYQLCKLVKKHDSTKHIPVVMLSGKDGMFDRLRGRLVGCSGYISKPFVPEVLLQAVEQHISGSAL